MAPTMLDYRGNKGFMILHKCDKCGKEMSNKAAEDDRLEKFSNGIYKYDRPSC